MGSNLEENSKLYRELDDRMGRAGRICDSMRSTCLGKREDRAWEEHDKADNPLW